MAVQFTNINNKDWVFFQGKYLFSDDEKTKILISDKTKKKLKDCINSCGDNNKCHWFYWNTEDGKCKQYSFIENIDSTFQWRYDSYKYEKTEVPKEVFNNAHQTETQEQCLNDCYNDVNCVAVNYIQKLKDCRIFYNYSNGNYYYGYYVIQQNSEHVGGEPTSIGNDIYDVKANIESNFSKIIGNILTYLLTAFLIGFVIFILYHFKKDWDKKRKNPPEQLNV
ncbi:hypothetical protein BCR32DRAFT_291153 [Anaeromyces robustus]|uniref:PAN-3 domain-containing protein n=1 Tax=Anaeromyces robustus TaxID=1754192 RepID=A0A1Y1XG15_9FUNG|nr:hypothetical protein BCR32DRAFT_291153 [Anaeromyces robustus]|eukprot:ORX84695.1 hypothetical protein BCR32DRAFT_291153 [Anaeromyces robustus]